MTDVVILHGRNCSSEMFWYPYIKDNLEKKGYNVSIPNLPNSSQAKLEEWLYFVLNNIKITKDTILIGHSAGAALILSILEEVKVKQAILVAGFAESETSKSILKENYDWEKIKSNVKDLIFINSNNDPYGCDDKKGKFMFDKLGGKQIILNGEGHMGSIKYKQSYKEFPFLLKLID